MILFRFLLMVGLWWLKHDLVVTANNLTDLDLQKFSKYLKEMIKEEVQLELRSLGTLPNATEWSEWSRCRNCVQKRRKMRAKSVLYEERPCDRKRCDRKSRSGKPEKMHVVRSERFEKATFRDEDDNRRSLPRKRRVWSKWSKWTDCAPNCITMRYRICKIPERCVERRQKQHAYCYHERTKCESYVLNLYDSRRRQDYDAYRYEEDLLVGQKRKKAKFPHSTRCGRPFRKSKMLRIIGGTESPKYKWPWHVAVLNRYMTVFCAGTLVHPKWVLTAGHCIRSYLVVRLNEHDLTALDGREIELVVQKSMLHPRFDQKTVDNDIALLKLPRAVKLPVACMPNRRPSTASKCTIMGWGKKRFGDRDGSPILREAHVQITDQYTCFRSYKGYVLTENMFCAGVPDGAADTCAGDSGGGLMCPVRKAKSFAYTLEGITSFGEGCGRANKYGIYTMVFNYYKWIKHTIENYT